MHLFSENTYKNRRQTLSQAIGKGLILLQGNDEASMNYKDNTYRYRQDSTFVYYFGLNQPGLNALIDTESGEEIIFGNEFSIDDIIWVGQQATIKELAQSVGITDTRAANALKPILLKAQSQGREIHFLPPYRTENLLKLEFLLEQSIQDLSQGHSTKLIKSIVDQRSIKTSEEIALMTEAVNVSREMHIAAMKATKPGKAEFEVVAEIYRVAKLHASYLAYPAIFSINGQILHNHHHDNKLESGRLLLNDSGAETTSYYSGDITRTFPVSGKFTEKQKEVYNIVLEMEESAIGMLKAGLAYRDIHMAANKLMLEQLKTLGLLTGDVNDMLELGVGGLFMPHGLGHQIGLDVHDMENLGEQFVGYRDGLERSTQLGLKSLRFAREIENGMVLTVEPGMYFIPDLIEKWKAEDKFSEFIQYDKLKAYYDFGGIRIEDDVQVTENGPVILGERIPKTVAEIEDIMQA
ncbi:aminopeptidase P family protein [Marinilongibacter aquaticus]|uniref:aminopeptidase P family protein n=1 Tax=Marinilongibacter aquaticus TaxID=2975157 RepID=UPI0021BD9E49|nr:aminopeptidase P family protein [Marinilongibacter aquaticus]UBM60385.1 aminopeptidase P family protein [Marinilongibacter aquaticus]